MMMMMLMMMMLIMIMMMMMIKFFVCSILLHFVKVIKCKKKLCILYLYC